MKFLITSLLLSLQVASGHDLALKTTTLSSENSTELKDRDLNELYDDAYDDNDDDDDSDNSAQSRIVGGWNAAVDDFPSFVNGARGCGATLIAPDVAIGAAHCKDFYWQGVYVGAMKRQSTQGGAEFFNVKKEIDHPQYGTSGLAYDMRLLFLQGSSSKTPAKLNLDPNFPPPNSNIDTVAVGMGATSFQGSSPGVTKEVIVPHVPFNTCKNRYGSSLKENIMVCAGREGKDSCQGDSGGPLYDITGKILIGVTSFGYQCAAKNAPGVYARISGALPWLKEQLCTSKNDGPRNIPLCGANQSSQQQTSVVPPSPSPPPPTGTKVVKVTVVHDNFPKEVSWSLRVNGSVQLSQELNTIQNKGQVNAKTTKANPGDDITFSINDGYGDGICCGQGKGSYQVSVDGNVLASGGAFGKSEQKVFKIPGASQVQQSAEQSPLQFFVEVKYDGYPTDNAWEVKNRDNKKIIKQVKATATFKGKVKVEPVAITIGTRYRFTITDSHGDGLLNGGYVMIYAKRGTKKFPIKTLSGDDIKARKRMFFKVKESNVRTEELQVEVSTKGRMETLSVRGVETNTEGTTECADTSTFIFVNKQLGDRDCGWLEDNADRFSYLCSFVGVAIACPKTCDMCAYFGP